jgi:putative transposase
MIFSESDRSDRGQLADELRHLGRREAADRTPKYSKAQILEILRAARDGSLIKDVCRQYAITDSTFYRWRKRYGQAIAAAPAATPEQQLRHAEAENRRLRKLLSDLDRMSA